MWRDEIAAYALAGNVPGVLRIFDELWSDRQRRMTMEIAHLQTIAELKGGKQPAKVGPGSSSDPAHIALLEAALKARTASTDARKAATARLGAP